MKTNPPVSKRERRRVMQYRALRLKLLKEEMEGAIRDVLEMMDLLIEELRRWK